jgi:thymidine phosphorylase
MTEMGMKSSKSGMMADKKSFEEFQNKINEIEGFPLELDLEVIVASEQMSFSMKTHSVVTKIDAKPINNKVFEIPAGYSLKE